MKRSLAALAAISAVVLSAPAALAGSDQPLSPVAPQISDKTGDSSGDAGTDIVSGVLTTTGTVTNRTITKYLTTTTKAYKKVKVVKKVHGKKKVTYKKVAYLQTVKTPVTTTVKDYTPDTLVVSMTMAGPIDTSPSTYDAFSFSTPKCGVVSIEYAPAATVDPGFADMGSCGGTNGADAPSVTPVISGSTVSFAIPFDKLSKTDIKAGTVLSKLSVLTGTADPLIGVEVSDDDTASTDASYTVS